MPRSLASALDRVAPAKRPSGPAAGVQRWRELLFMHWPVPIEVVRPLVPKRLELDVHDGVLWLGVVPFRMEGVRPSWSPEALAFDFLETNLRTYVHVNGEPGVFFFSLEAASWIAVRAARIGWGLPYFFADMVAATTDGVVEYTSTRVHDPSASLRVRYMVGDALGPSRAGTLEHFLLERYLLFVERGGEILRGQVHHVPYPAQRAEVLEVSEGLVAAAGLPATKGLPPLVHYAAGVDVEVFALAPI